MPDDQPHSDDCQCDDCVWPPHTETEDAVKRSNHCSIDVDGRVTAHFSAPACREPDEVFDSASLATFVGAPLTAGPEVPANGRVTEIEATDEGFVRARIRIDTSKCESCGGTLPFDHPSWCPMGDGT